jgi:hypothetical protein
MINRQRLVLIAVTLTLFFSVAKVSADQKLIQDDGSWVQVVAEGSLKSVDPELAKVRVWLEGQARFNNDFNQFYQGVARIALGYSVTDRATIWAGYTWVPTHQVGKMAVSQQEIMSAFRYILPTDIGTITFRTMIQGDLFQGSDIRIRPRQLVYFRHPLEFEPRLSLIVWDEVHVRLNPTLHGGKAGFDQNRAFLGGGWTVNPNVRFELGYLNQYIDNAIHTTSTMQHLITGSLFISF